jgi:5-methylcytosine-specific restriction endonuclease McrA
MDTTRIAHIVKRDPKSVWNWLKDFGIATRKRGHASTHKFPKGYKSMLGKKHTAETRKRLSDIAKADGRVPYDPAIGSYMKGRSGASTPNWKGGITPQRQSVYSSTEWAACVKAVWKRENATCERCGIRKNEAGKTPFDIHHIVGFECVELRTVASNLALLCEPCHYWVHSRKNTRGAFIKRNLAKIERENATGELIPHTVEE